MRLNVPQPRPLPSGPDIPSATPTYGQTANAQFSNLFGPMSQGLDFYTQTGGYEPNAVESAEAYVEAHPELTDSERHIILTQGLGSANLTNAASYVTHRRQVQDTMSRATGLNLFFSDPAVMFSVAIPFVGVRAALSLGTALGRVQGAGRVAGIGPALTSNARLQFGGNLSSVAQLQPQLLTNIRGIGPARAGAAEAAFSRPASMAANAAAIMRGEGIGSSAAQIARLGALDAAVVDGSISLTQALNEIGVGGDPVEEIGNAALLTLASTAIGGSLGYGIGRVLNAPYGGGRFGETPVGNGLPAREGERTQQFRENFRNWLNETSDRPLDRGEDVSFAGQWFMNSWFMRLVPSPLRTELGDLRVPNWAKQYMLDLIGDNGVPTLQNQRGVSHGNSVHLNAGRRSGEWYQTLSIINDNYRQINARGATEVLNVPIGAAIERTFKLLGRDNIAPQDWYTRIGRLYIDEVPFDQMSPQEAASVQALEGFFKRYEDELVSEGLMNPRDIIEDGFYEEAGRQFELISVTNSIIQQNRNWMRSALDDIAVQFEKKQNRLNGLSRTENTRGLTDKQLELRAKLEEEITMLQRTQTYFEELLEKIDNAKNVDELSSLYNQLSLTEAQRNALKKIGKAMDETRARIDNALELVEANAGRQTRRHFPRFYNRRAIEERRDEFKSILTEWFVTNNKTIRRADGGGYKIVELSPDPADAAKRADDTIDAILGEIDDDATDAIFNGSGRSGPLMSRRLDIPNHLIKDFLVTDAKEVMIAYTQRVAPRLEYYKKFRNPSTGKLMSFNENLAYIRERMTSENVPEEVINRYIKNFVGSYDRVVGGAIKNPDALDTRIANGLRTATTWTYLGTSGVAALGDLASLFMDHELSTIGKGFLSLLDDVRLGMGKEELNLAGEGLEVNQGITHLRYMESLTNNSMRNSVADRLNNAFFVANGLGPITVLVKSMDSLFRGHTIIDSAQKLINGTASEFDTTFLARYNIDEDMARRFLAQPFERSNNGLVYPNTKAWTDEEAVIAFRNALRSGVMNRVIMGTPADKPLTMDGVAYIPEGLAKTLPFGDSLPTDPRVQGYRRIESGLLALPFTFYSYTMGALTKITANHAAGAVRNRLAHIAVAMGLGAMIVQLRTPSYVWDKMDTEDKIMRAFDFSGLAALYSDMTYRAIAMGHELGFDPNFPIQPKFMADPDPLGAIISIGGAPADWTYDLTSAVGDMLSGQYSDGAKGLIRSMPFISALAVAGGIRDDALALANQIPQSR